MWRKRLLVSQHLSHPSICRRSGLQRARGRRAESLGYTVVDPPSIIATHLTEVIRSHIAELLTRQDVQNLVNNLKESNPVLVDELIPKMLGLGEVQKVLQNLLDEGFPSAIC